MIRHFLEEVYIWIGLNPMDFQYICDDVSTRGVLKKMRRRKVACAVHRKYTSATIPTEYYVVSSYDSRLLDNLHVHT